MRFDLTPEAAKKILELVESWERPALGLRVGVRGGGCSGFSYFMEVCEESAFDAEKDERFEHHGATVVVDRRSLKVIDGTELHWKSSLMGAAFEFRNPQAKQTCGCGSSFAT
ncbi:MAG: iron-sulfur cluster assembly accessory protein [Deltaproteobacteria bacterium]|nr:iron-sulfur cluster assembly accessory protein [Deltaproteobacteria bacterium]